MIVLNDLLGYKNLKIYQNNEYFCFSIDSVLLANFVKINKKVKNIIDFGTGNAVIPLILSTKTKANIVGVELQKEIYDMALNSVICNNLTNQVKIINDDMKNLNKVYNHEYFDLITCNPPYFKHKDTSLVNKNVIKTIARHEININFDEIAKQAAYLLKENGEFVFVHRPDRLLEIIEILKKYKLEVKEIRFVYPKITKNANIILVRCIKNGKVGLKIINPLYIHDDKGYTDEVIKFFE